ncbi:MAG TPA: hypothetical protein DHW63_12075 [Hyphomonadaceae bacterium]|nr:hypothetical protein [Hyphomonadaceae bacterium]
MTKTEAPLRTLISTAFDGDSPPPRLSVAVVSLVELCQRAMPDPIKLRAALVDEAGFDVGRPERAEEIASIWALDNKLIATPVRGLRHEIFGRLRHQAPVLILLSVGESEGKEVVFVTAFFSGATEADVIKAVTHVTKKPPFGGGRVSNASGATVRRAFWDVEGEAGVRAMVACGPDNVEALDPPRAIIAFNFAAAKT